MNRVSILAAGVLALAASSASATVLNFEYAADGTAYTPVSGDFDRVMQAGDTANMTLRTAPNKALQVSETSIVWALLGFREEATRQGDYSYSFSLNGAQVAAGSISQASSFMHMGPYLRAGFTGMFDEFHWSGVLTASGAIVNTTTNAMAGGYGYGYTGLQLVDAADSATAVPEPASLALVGAGLLALGLRRRRA